MFYKVFTFELRGARSNHVNFLDFPEDLNNKIKDAILWGNTNKRTGADPEILERGGPEAIMCKFLERGGPEAIICKFLERGGPEAIICKFLERGGPEAIICKFLERGGPEAIICKFLERGGPEAIICKFLERGGPKSLIKMAFECSSQSFSFKSFANNYSTKKGAWASPLNLPLKKNHLVKINLFPFL